MLMSLDTLDTVSPKIDDFKNKRWWSRPLGKSKNKTSFEKKNSFLLTVSAYKIFMLLIIHHVGQLSSGKYKNMICKIICTYFSSILVC